MCADTARTDSCELMTAPADTIYISFFEETSYAQIHTRSFVTHDSDSHHSNYMGEDLPGKLFQLSSRTNPSVGLALRKLPYLVFITINGNVSKLRFKFVKT